jgi:hypothetical protein
MATPTNLPASFVSGEILTAANMNLLRGGFRILQVVQGTTTTVTNTTSATFVDTSLTATITPQFSTSKIFAMITQSVFVTVSSTDTTFILLRGGTTIATNLFVGYGGASANNVTWALNYLDSPVATTATTYKTQMRRDAGTGTITAQLANSISTLTLFEVSA